jgi:hypothetical protein
MNYSVSVVNCGTCNQDPYISRTNVTCDQLEPGQQMLCNVTVQSISECGTPSAPLIRMFEGMFIDNIWGCLPSIILCMECSVDS